MENVDGSESRPNPLSAKKENLQGPKIPDLSEPRQELISRIQNLKQDLQSWRTKLDTQVTAYRNELSDLKKSMNTEVDQLRTEFQELRNVLQQQADMASSLRNLVLQDEPVADSKETEGAAKTTTEENHAS